MPPIGILDGQGRITLLQNKPLSRQITSQHLIDTTLLPSLRPSAHNQSSSSRPSFWRGTYKVRRRKLKAFSRTRHPSFNTPHRALVFLDALRDPVDLHPPLYRNATTSAEERPPPIASLSRPLAPPKSTPCGAPERNAALNFRTSFKVATNHLATEDLQGPCRIHSDSLTS